MGYKILSQSYSRSVQWLAVLHPEAGIAVHFPASAGHFHRYMVGQFSEINRKSIEPIALSVEGGNVRAMQRFISDAEWNEERIEYKYRNMVNDDMGHPDGAVLFDESSYVKKGQNSIGVSRQYAGSIGKTENCQVGVFAAYTSASGYALIDKRLYIPEKWFGEDYKERRIKCNFPEDTKFKTKPELAVEMLDQIAKENILPFRYVLADSIYGENPSFLEAVESLVGVTYFVSVGSDTPCWLKRPVTMEKNTSSGKKLIFDVLKHIKSWDDCGCDVAHQYAML